MIVEIFTIEKGRIVDSLVVKNTLTNTGREYIAKIIGGLHTKPFKYIQIGTGTKPPSNEDTELDQFYAEKEASVEEYRAWWVEHPYWIANVLDCTFSFSEEVTITEAGIFDDLHTNSPNMLARVVFSPRYMTPDKTLRIRWGIRVF